MHDSTAVMASPPRNWPTSALPASVSRLLIPPRLMMLAASTKNGMAISGNVFRELNNRSGTWVSGIVVK